ncbi:MAG: helix-turn-helix transcriptional regulator [Bacteroidota bacterium]
MDRLAMGNIRNIVSLENELEYEKATSLYLRLRVLIKEDASYQAIRDHLRDLIRQYEKKNWNDDKAITDNQIRESVLAESLVQAENEFSYKRKELIKNKLRASGLNQNDLAKILDHRKGYMSELINGLRPFSKEDIVIISQLFKIKLEHLVPPFVKLERAQHIRKTLRSMPNSRNRLTSY